MLVDSHCHLDFLERQGEELSEVIGRAQRAGVGCFVTISTKLSEFDRVRSIAERFDEVYCSVGVHPHEANDEGQGGAERLLALAEHPKVVAIGESGLDYFYEHSPRAAQQTSFRAHIDAARKSGLPLIVHTRDADEDTIAILEEEYARGPFPGLIHCFTAGPALAEAALSMGFFISLAGIVTFRKAEELRETVSDIPLDRLLLETDAPYLAPVPKRGKVNEPAFIVHTAAALAELKGVSLEELAAATTHNFFSLFNKVPAPR